MFLRALKLGEIFFCLLGHIQDTAESIEIVENVENVVEETATTLSAGKLQQKVFGTG